MKQIHRQKYLHKNYIFPPDVVLWNKTKIYQPHNTYCKHIAEEKQEKCYTEFKTNVLWQLTCLGHVKYIFNVNKMFFSLIWVQPLTDHTEVMQDFTQCGACMHSYVHTCNKLYICERDVKASMSNHLQDFASPPSVCVASKENEWRIPHRPNMMRNYS